MKIPDMTPLNPQGKVDPEQWLERIASIYRMVGSAQLDFLKSQVEIVRILGSSIATDFQENAFESGLRMAAVLGELNADIDALCGALWFQTVFHAGVSREELLKKSNKSIANIVHGALELKVSTALSGLYKKDLGQMDRLRKMFLTMVNDARVVLVKLAERVIAMRFSKHWDSEKRLALAHSVFHIYAPLANRLGIGQLKWELEDRAFMVINSSAYQKITQALDEKRVSREAYMQGLIREIKSELTRLGVLGEVDGRVKHIYSIYRKMTLKKIDFDQLFDIRALRILVKDVRSCYEVLGYLHENFEPILSEFSDYIAQPKPNGYRSIHTVIKDLEGRVIEVQIRTFSMHEESEMGVAAHWRYKEGVSHDAGYETRIQWLRSLLDWQDSLGADAASDHSTAKDLVASEKSKKALNDSLHDSLRYQHIYVFTPLGDVIDLEAGSTPVDFAYRVHTEVGHRCRGAKVNGRIVPLTYELRTGDRVEILTGKESKPSRDWLRQESGFIRSSAARHKISLWFRQQQEAKIQPVSSHLLTPISSNSSNELLNFSDENAGGKAKSQNFQSPKNIQGDLIIEGEDNLLFKMAGCCLPILGDAVGGYITQGRGISIHRLDCKSFSRLQESYGERILTAEWGENTKASYLVELHLEAFDRPGLLKDITQVLLGENLSILSLRSVVNAKNDTAKIALAFMVKEKNQVGRATHLLMQIPKMLSVSR
jgi:GTP pyrophosphokinase